MSIAPYIKQIGRGQRGARSLTEAQARDLMAQVLAGHASDLEVGAFAMAMRIKGETTEELAGFLEAVRPHCMAVETARPLVVLPSYNGARKLPNLTALLAWLLAREGVVVLVQGLSRDPGRVSTRELFEALGLPVAHDGAQATRAWAQGLPVFVPIDALCPALARLLATRQVIGVRSSGHTVAKLLDPTPRATALRVVNYTHTAYRESLAALLEHTVANAMLLRGTEGEPVADARRRPRLDVFVGGQHRPDVSRDAQEGSLVAVASMPATIDAATTAAYIHTLMRGELPVPAPILEQVQCLRETLHAMASAPIAGNPA